MPHRRLKVKRLDGLIGSVPMLPTRAHSDDAGFDLYVSDDRIINPGEFVDIPTGIAVEIPSDCWGMLAGRSSTLRKRGLLVNQGIIDPGYRGELFAGVWNLGTEEVYVRTGERLAQLILMPNVTAQFQVVAMQELSEHERGEKGFGSSGN